MKPVFPRLRRPRFVRVLMLYFKRPANVFAGVVIALVCFMALFADVLASELPIACRLEGNLYILPAVTGDGRLNDEDNQSIVEKISHSGGWALLPPVPYGPDQSRVSGRIQWLVRPSASHLLGTDDSGRDVLARIIHGSRTAALVGVGSMVLCTLFGVLLGALAAYFGGLTNKLTVVAIETLTAFPTFFLILGIQGLFGTSSFWQLVLIIAVTRWTDVARVTRAEVLRTVNEDYVDAARALGLSHLRILTRHVMPAATGPVLVASTFGVAGAILIESTLSFLGYGVPVPTASWGGLLADAFAADALWLSIVPGLLLTATVLSVNLVGEGLGESADLS